jgi:hypothetical protein
VGVGFEGIEPGRGVSVAMSLSGESRVGWAYELGSEFESLVFVCSLVPDSLFWGVLFGWVNFKCVRNA